MEDSAEVDESAFAQELSDASDHIMIYRRVVHLVDVELKKTIPIGAVTVTVTVTSDDVASTSEVGSSNVDTEPTPVEHTVVSQPPSFTPQLTSLRVHSFISFIHSFIRVLRVASVLNSQNWKSRSSREVCLN